MLLSHRKFIMFMKIIIYYQSNDLTQLIVKSAKASFSIQMSRCWKAEIHFTVKHVALSASLESMCFLNLKIVFLFQM